MKKLALALSLTALCVPASHALELNEELSLNLTVTALSDYRPRGISYTQNDPALQFDAMLYSKSTGLYLGAWTSTVDYGYGSNVRHEVDYYAGWYVPLGEKLVMDLGYIKYTYPRGNSDNSSEVYAMLSAYGFTLAGQYSDDVPALGSKHSYLYSWLGYQTQLPYDVVLDARFGQVDYKDPWLVSGSGKSREAYREWEAKVSKEAFSLNWSLAYADTDLSRHECMNLNGFDDVCSATAVVGVSKSF